MIARFAELLSVEQVERIHEASLEILEDVGTVVYNEKERARFAHHGCRLDALMVFDFATAVIGSEIAQMLKRVARGIGFSEENLALNLIAEVGPGGTFIDSRHTLERIRTTALLPEIANRRARAQWQARGALDAHARATQRIRDILTRDNPAAFSPDVDAQILAEFEGLVPGDARIEWPSSEEQS